MIELVFMHPQTRFDIAQTFPVSELRECHAKKLIETCEGLDAPIALVALYASTERLHRQIFHDLRKHVLT